MAGITNLTVASEGFMGSILKATIAWNCWSLDDLQYYDDFFLTIGKSIMVEWGWSIPGDIIKTFSKDELHTSVTQGKIRVLENGGNYGVCSGVISNFEWSLNDAGGFDCTTDIIAHGQPMMEAKTEQGADLPSLPDDAPDDVKKKLEELGMNNLQKYLNNMEMELLKHINPGHDWTNPAGVDEYEGDVKYTDKNIEIRDTGNKGAFMEAWVSWGWFEDNIISKYLGRVSDADLKYMMRSIAQEGIDDDFESVKILAHPEMKTADARILIIPEDDKGTSAIGDFEPFFVPNSGKKLGYLRNLKLNTDTIREAFEDASTLQDGMERLFKEVKWALFDVPDFRLENDSRIGGNNRVIDYGYSQTKVRDAKGKRSTYDTNTFALKEHALFFFPTMLAENNLVIEQSMEASVPSDSMYAAMYTANQPDGEEEQDTDNPETSTLANVQKSEGKEDILLAGFSIPDANKNSTGKYGNDNPNEYTDEPWRELDFNSGPKLVEGAELSIPKDAEDDVAKTEEIKEDVKKEAESEHPPGDPTKDMWAITKWWQDTSVSKMGIIDSLTSEVKGEEVMAKYIYDWTRWKIQYGDMAKKDDSEAITKQKDFILPLEMELKIDGICGIYPGNCFMVEYIPEKYKKETVLVVKEVKHDITSAGWETTLTAMMVADF